jgi:Ca2+-binding EF-hand superfamily protein
MKDLCQGLELLTNGSQIEKLQFLFKVYDIDGESFLILPDLFRWN